MLVTGAILTGCLAAHSEPFVAPSDAEIDYFLEVALGSEGSSPRPRLIAWREPPRLTVRGCLQTSDSEAIAATLADLNGFYGKYYIRRIAMDGTLQMTFLPRDDFRLAVPAGFARASGYVYLWWDADFQIRRGVIFIRCDVPASRRAHIIREELTQSMGLLRDSWRYPESIFYQGFSETIAFAPIDSAVLRLHARLRSHAGSDSTSLRRRLRRMGDRNPPVP